MHVLRVFLLVAVVCVASSEGFLKKDLFKHDKHEDKSGGFGAAVKHSALKFAAGAALKKAAIIGGFKAIGKAKDDFFDGIKQAKLNVVKKIATIKLAKLAALKAGKLAFLKTLAIAKLAPIIAEKIKADHFKGHDDEKTGNIFLDGLVGLVGGGGAGAVGFDNPIGGILGDLILGGIKAGGPNFDFGKIIATLGGGLGIGGLGGLGGLGGIEGIGGPLPVPVPAALEPIPLPGKPEINIQTYQVNSGPPHIESYGPPPQFESYAPSHYESYGPPEIVHSYGPPSSSPSHSYGQPATSYGVPGPY